ncbi:MAG: hypothetical protein FWD36_09490 [Treponema sp.]|nr:hypothetical protein [Treponema sp.]
MFLVSCGAKEQPVLFSVWGTNQTLYGMNREAAEGFLDFSKPKKLEYRFTAAPLASSVMEPVSFEIEYSFGGSSAMTDAPAAAGNTQLVLEIAGHSWILPHAFDGTVFHYAVPFTQADTFTIVLTGNAAKNNSVRFRIHSIGFTGRWFGFYRRQDASHSHLYLSPFVSRQPGGTWVIDPPANFDVPAGFFPSLSAGLLPGNETSITAGNRRFIASSHLTQLNVPAEVIAHNATSSFAVSGDRAASFRLVYTTIPPFPEPISADPGLVLTWPLETWRDSRYEVFRWESFPSLLIFDFADYAVQDRMLKRLAFFVEKTGFRGRLSSDAEIGHLHGWNAHDYCAEDLARFFQTARNVRFPLLAEERELERILLNTGIIRELGGEIQGGEGGIISVTREAPEYLRFRFMAHEGYHGLYFVDEDFRTFSRNRWQQFPAEAKRFMVSYFNFQQYDTSDEFILIKEFASHILQQSVSQAGHYFGQTLPSRLENTWRKADLPDKDESSGAWPVLAAAFTREAESFSGYVGRRWGIAAGRVHLVTVRQP